MVVGWAVLVGVWRDRLRGCLPADDSGLNRNSLRLRLAEFDSGLARRIVARQSRTTAAVLPRVSNAANHSGIWLVAAGVVAMFGDRAGRRAAQRGLISVGVASAVANGLLKPLFPRARPPVDPDALPAIVRRPTSSSFPSGHTASAVAFAAAVAIEAPVISIPVSALAAGVAYSRITTGVHYPSDVLAGAAIGLAAAAATTRVWPRVDSPPASARAVSDRSTTEPSQHGDGLTLVVNATAGPSDHDATVAAIRDELPEVKVVLVEASADLESELSRAAREAVALGVLGGDGTLGTAAAAALEADVPLVVFPGGTLNHFARNLGVDALSDAIAAVRAGQLVEVDTATIDGRTFLNTASFGGYSDFVEAREQYEERMGKWPAVAVALVKVLLNREPIRAELNGSRTTTWMIFIGNCAYDPPGFVPSTRTRLDDGKLDVRFVDGSAPFARLRLVTAVLTGRLARSKVYSRWVIGELRVATDREETMLAADGETFHGPGAFVISKSTARLRTYAPHR